MRLHIRDGRAARKLLRPRGRSRADARVATRIVHAIHTADLDIARFMMRRCPIVIEIWVKREGMQMP
jgi:hypothetical protein